MRPHSAPQALPGEHGEQSKPGRHSWGLTLGALGVVFGDIGTSPLYALNQVFAHVEMPATRANVIGSVSLVIWALTLVITLKYLTFVLRADNDGEGGVFALYGLLHQLRAKRLGPFLLLLLLAAGLLFGDGMITPAISVLSAVEGVKLALPGLATLVVPLTLLILTGLFAIQRQGTAKIGVLFGPVIVVWFAVIAVLGGWQLARTPAILEALNPWRGLAFLGHAGGRIALLALGGVMLAITGGEALYADMGHFGKAPIRRGWLIVVFPALLLNYLGQGAYLLSGQPVGDGNVFYSMVPKLLIIPVVLLATVATIIASQALISGAFSLAAQATALGLFPRLKIIHTHHQHEGQIYVPFVNWALYVGCALLAFSFGSSNALASAYGLAVGGDMLATSIALALVARLRWRWALPQIVLLFGGFVVIDLAFLTANSLKFLEGGYVPLSIGASLFLVMTTWRWGRKTTFAAYSAVKTMTIRDLVAIKEASQTLLDKNIILMVPRPVRGGAEHAPALLQLFWSRYHVLPKNLLFVEVAHKKVPYIRGNRYEVTTIQQDPDPARGAVIAVTISFGFMEQPNVERILESLASHHQINLPTDPHKWLVHVSQENLIPARHMRFIDRLRHRLFALLRQISQPGHYYYGLGDEVQLAIDIMPVKLA